MKLFAGASSNWGQAMYRSAFVVLTLVSLLIGKTLVVGEEAPPANPPTAKSLVPPIMSSAVSLPQPTSFSTEGNMYGTTVKFQWDAVSGADSYILWVNDETDSINPLILAELTGTEYLSINKLFGREEHLFRWTVISVDGGVWGPSTSNTTFRITPPKPSLTAPSSGATMPNTTVTFNWSTVTDAFTYDLCVNDITTSAEVYGVIQQTVSGTSYGSSGTLHDGHTYAWTVRTRFQDGSYGPWAIRRTFSVDTSEVTLSESIDMKAARAVQFVWKETPGASRYEIEVFANSTDDKAETSNGPLIRQLVEHPIFGAKAELFEEGKSYSWRVRAISESSAAGVWSERRDVDHSSAGIAKRPATTPATTLSSRKVAPTAN